MKNHKFYQKSTLFIEYSMKIHIKIRLIIQKIGQESENSREIFA